MSASPFRQYTTSQQVNGKLEQTRAGKAQQATGKPKSKLPFGGTRRGTPPKPHAGGPTPEVAAAQSWPAQVVRTGRVKGKYNIKRKQVFAVVELGPTQFKVSPGDAIVSEKIRDVDVNDKIKLSRVFMLGSKYETVIGRPLIPDAAVHAVVEEQFQDAKVLIFKKRRRKNSRRLTGHRQPLTTVRVVDIEGIEEEPDSKACSPSDEHPENDSDGIEKAA